MSIRSFGLIIFQFFFWKSSKITLKLTSGQSALVGKQQRQRIHVPLFQPGQQDLRSGPREEGGLLALAHHQRDSTLELGEDRF